MVEEKLPERFEKDIFVHEKKQRSWEDLVVGEIYDTVPFVVTEERIKMYIDGTEDFNPVYVDEKEAGVSQFGGLIAPPTIVVPIVFASLPTDSWVKMPGAINPGQTLELGVPVRAGDTLSCQSKLIDKFIKRNKKYAIVEFRITNQNGEFVCLWQGGLILEFQSNPALVRK